MRCWGRDRHDRGGSSTRRPAQTRRRNWKWQHKFTASRYLWAVTWGVMMWDDSTRDPGYLDHCSGVGDLTETLDVEARTNWDTFVTWSSQLSFPDPGSGKFTTLSHWSGSSSVEPVSFSRNLIVDPECRMNHRSVRERWRTMDMDDKSMNSGIIESCLPTTRLGCCSVSCRKWFASFRLLLNISDKEVVLSC